MFYLFSSHWYVIEVKGLCLALGNMRMNPVNLNEMMALVKVIVILYASMMVA